jgi:hypothetical protein
MPSCLRAPMGAALCLSLVTTGCSSGGGAFPAVPSGAQSIAQTRAAAKKIAGFAIGASDYCPSKPGVIRLTFAAVDSPGDKISGAFSSPIKLMSSDHSGESRLSATAIQSSNQKVTVAYLKNKDIQFTITAWVGKLANNPAAIRLNFSPGGECINPSPPMPVLKGRAARVVTLGGPGTGPAYELVDALHGSGCGTRVAIDKTSSTTFQVAASSGAGTGGCEIWAGTQGGFFAKALPVLLTK